MKGKIIRFGILVMIICILSNLVVRAWGNKEGKRRSSLGLWWWFVSISPVNLNSSPSRCCPCPYCFLSHFFFPYLLCFVFSHLLQVPRMQSEVSGQAMSAVGASLCLCSSQTFEASWRRGENFPLGRLRSWLRSLLPVPPWAMVVSDFVVVVVYSL